MGDVDQILKQNHLVVEPLLLVSQEEEEGVLVSSEEGVLVSSEEVLVSSEQLVEDDKLSVELDDSKLPVELEEVGGEQQPL